MSNFPYKKSISPIQLLGTQSVNREATYGTHFSTDGIGGYMEVFNVTDLIFTIPTGQTGSIEYTGNTIPVNLLKGGAGPFSTDVLTLNPDNISSGRRKLGMLVYVYEYDQVYQFAIDNYETLWNNATGATNTVVISEYGTTVNTSTPEGQLLVSSWTANTIDGISGVTRSNAVWKKYYGTNLAVTGGSFNGVTGTLTLTNITGGTQNITGFGSGGGGGAPITGGTFDSSNLELDLTSSAGTITVTGVTGLYISAGTYSSGNTTLSLSNSTGGTITITGFSQTFSGGSGNCINQLYLNEIYPCTSDIKIQPLSTGRVYFGNNSGASGLTIDFNSETAQKSARLGLNINNPEYTFDFKSFDRKSGFFFRDDIVAPFGDWKQIAISGDTDNVLMYTSFQPDASGSLGSHGIAIGSRGYGNSSTTTNNSLGRTGDTFVLAFSNTNGLNIINGPGTNTDDYIRFYAGQTVGSNTPDVHIQGSGSTRGFVGIGTTAVTNPLHVYATSNPLRLEGLQSSANTRFLVANSDGVVTYTTTAPSGGGGFSAVSINNVVQFDTSASQTINFSGVNINITSASTNTLVFSGGGVTVPGSNNQVLTSNGSGGIVAESLLTFDGLASSPPLNVNGITIWRGKNNTSKSIGIGPLTLNNTTSGAANIAIGPGSQTNTDTGYNNISIGLSSLSANTSGNRNIAIGTCAMNLNSGGYGNVAIGDRSLYKHYIGDFNIAIGASSLYYSDTKFSGTDFNIAIGRCAMFYNSGGTENIAIGRRALAGNNPNKQFGNFNIALGRGSLYQNYNGDYNIAIGRSSLYSNSTGLHNVAIGRNSNGENTTGNNNISIGYNSLYYNTTGLGNVSIGTDTLYSNVYGDHNVSIGYLSGKNSAGSRNVFIGRESGFNEVNSDRLHIANCQTRIPLIFGEFDTNRLGVNTTTVTNTLHVSATTHPVRFEGLQSSANTRYLVANSDGVVTYVTGTTGSFSGDYLPLSGGTVTGGTVFQSGLTSNNGFTATTIDNTYINTFYVRDNTGTVAIDVSNRKLTKSDGSTTVFDWENGILTGLTTIIGSTISATTYLNLPVDPDTYVTGFTLNSNTVTLSQNRNDQYSAFTINLSAYTGNTGISGDYLPLSGGTVTGLTNFNSGLTSNSITATTISASTYLNVPNYNAGLLINSDQWVNNNDGTVTLPTTYVALYSQTGYPSTVEVYLITSGTSGTEFPALSNNDTNYIVVDYNSGSPTWNILTDNSTINGVTIVLTHIIYRANNFLHVLDFGDEGFALPNKLNDRVIAIDRFGRESGFSLGLSASTGVVTLTSGVAWNGTNRQSLVAVNSQDDIFFQVYHTGGTWTYTTSANTLNNLYYDNGTNPVLATSGKYLVNWYFRGQEINDHLYEVWGNDEYDNVSEAQLSTEPNLPELITSHAFLTGRIIVQVSATTGTVESAFVQVFQPTTVQSHNDLTGIQGGTSGEYYHLTSSQYSNLSSFKNIQINNVTQFSSTTLTDSLNFSGVNINITSGVGNTLIFSAGTGGELSYYISASTPTGTIVSGDRWFNTDTGIELVYVNDGDSSQWIQPNGSLGSFTGNTSANCISQLYVTNVYGCSPINFNDPVNLKSGATFSGTTTFNGPVNLNSGFTSNSIIVTAATVNGNLSVTGTTSSISFSGNSDTISGTKGTVTTSGSSTTAFIDVTGSNTLGGANYIDFLRVTNNSVGTTNGTKTIRVNNTGGMEFLNSAYTAVTLTISDNGILFLGGGGVATVSNNDATSNYLYLNGNNSQIYDDGNTHIHSRGSGQSMWINTNGGPLNLLTQSTVNGGAIGSGIAIATTTLVGYVTINTGKTYSTSAAYGYLTTGGAGTYPGGSQTVDISLYATARVWAQEIDAFSDERMKDIEGEIELDEALKLVNDLKPIKYTWKEGNDKGLKVGYSAQQVSKAGFDHLISLIPKEGLEETIDEDGFVSPKDTQFSMNYDQVTPYHGVVIKHLLEEIEVLKKEINELKNKIK